MRKLRYGYSWCFLAIGLLVSSWSWSQQGLYLQGANLYNLNSDDLYIGGDLINDTNSMGISGKIFNLNSIHFTGDLINHSTDSLFGIDSAGTIIFNGNSQQHIAGQGINCFALKVNNSFGLQLENNIVVNDTLQLIEGGIDLNGDTLILKSNIGAGYLTGEDALQQVYGDSGEVRTTRNVVFGGNVGGMGLELAPNQLGAAVTIRRGHQSLGAGDGGIKRYFIVEPITVDTVALELRYLDPEIGSMNEADFQLYQSTDGFIWRQQNSTAFPILDKITAAEVFIDNITTLTIAEATCAQPPPINFASDTLYQCGNDSVLLDTRLNSSYAYEWITGATAPLIYAQNPGTYTVAVVDSAGCISIDSVIIIAAPKPVAKFSTNLLTCLGDSNLFDADSSTISSGSIDAYIWDYFNDNTTVDTVFTSTHHYLYNIGDSIPVKLITQSDKGCLDSIVDKAYIDSLPFVGFTFIHACEDSAVIFNTTSYGRGLYRGINTVTWDYGNGQTSTGYIPQAQAYTTAGNYTIQQIFVEDGGECRDTAIQTITIHDNPVADFIANQVCENDTTRFINTTTNGATYNWDFGNGNGSNSTHPSQVYTQDGTYAVNLQTTSSFGCTHDTTKMIFVNTRPIADFVATHVCFGDSTNFEQTAVDANAPIYSWNFGDATSSIQTNPNHLYSNAGSYQVALWVQSSNGCADSITQTINVFDLPTANFTLADNCEDSLIAMTNNSSIPNGGITSYFWDFGNGQTSTDSLPMVSFSSYGGYNVSLLATSNWGCQDTQIQVIEIHYNPIINWTDTITTCAASYILDATNTGSNYNWNTGATTPTLAVTNDSTYSVMITTPFGCQNEDSTVVLLNIPVILNLGPDTTVCDSLLLDAFSPTTAYAWSTLATTPTIQVTSSGQYFVERLDQNNCYSTDTINIVVHTSPTVNLGPDRSICNGETQLFDAGNAGFNFNWNTGAGTQSINTTTAGFYWVTVTDPITQCYGWDTIELIVNPLPVLNLGSDTTVCDTLTLAPGNFASYAWNNGSSGSQLTVYEDSTIWLTVGTAFNCYATDTMVITVDTSPSVELGADTLLCQGASITLQGASIGAHSWSTGSTQTTQLVDAAGIYFLDVVDGICTTSDTIAIQYEAPWSVDLGGDTGTCNDNTVILYPNTTLGLNFEWHIDQNWVSNADSLLATTSGTYSIIAINANGCREYDTIRFVSNPYPVVADFLMASNAYVGDIVHFVPVTLDTSISYHWYFGNGGISTDKLPTYRYVLPRIYDVRLVVSNNFCSDSLTKSIDIGTKTGRFVFDPSQYTHTEETLLDVRIYPNPNTGTFNLGVLLSENNPVSIHLMGLQGKVIARKPLTDAMEQYVELDFTDHITPGMYILVVRSGVETKTVKVIVQ